MIEADVFDRDIALRDRLGVLADLVVTNPPYFEGGEPASPTLGRASAHVMEGGTLDGWVAAAARLLRHRGRICLIHRADGLQNCLDALDDGSFGSLVVTPIYPAFGKAAVRLVVSGIRGGRSPISVGPAIVLHGPDGRFTAEAERLHGAPPASALA